MTTTSTKSLGRGRAGEAEKRRVRGAATRLVAGAEASCCCRFDEVQDASRGRGERNRWELIESTVEALASQARIKH